MAINIESLSIQQMRELVEKLEARIIAETEKIRTNAIAQIKTLMGESGVNMKDLATKRKKKVSRKKKISSKQTAVTKKKVPVKTKLKPKYRAPGGETWTGRGQPIKALSKLIQAGHKKEDFLIGKDGKTPFENK